MGKTAQPGVDYCTGLAQAALSVGGKIIRTDNPPITYEITETELIVTDALGTLAVFDLSVVDGELTAEYAQPAIPDTDYCDGKAKAVLTWDGGGKIETLNPPISYSLVAPGTGIQVDWGGGDIDFLTGTTWEEIKETEYLWQNFAFSLYRNGVYQGDFFLSQFYGQPSPFRFSGHPEGGEEILNAPYTKNLINPYIGGLPWNTAEGIQIRSLKIDSERSIVLLSLISVGPGYTDTRTAGDIPRIIKKFIRIETNTGETSERETTTPPAVSLLDENYQLAVSDSTGEIFTQEYSSEPTGFGVTCYYYDIKQVNYSCESECPAGTEFQCRCPATNTLSCYGWEGDTFKPLYVTKITP